MEVSFEEVFFSFTSSGGVEDVLVMLQLLEQIINDANSMCIVFSVKHPQTFWEL